MYIQKKERESNFELLRIISIFFIVLHHMAQHGIWINPQIIHSSNNLPSAFFIEKLINGFPGFIGNWVFIYISGYFISNTSFSWKKFFRQWLQLFSTSALIGLILFFLGTPVIGFNNHDYPMLGYAAARPMEIGDLIKSFLPTYFCSNWFIVAYLLFYLFTPFLNIFLNKIDKKTHFKLTILLVILGKIIKILPGQEIYHSDDLFDFIMGYFIINYIKLYKPTFFASKKRNLIIVLMISFSYFTSVYVLFKFLCNIPFIASISEPIYMGLKGITFIPALFLFCFFRDIKIKQNKFINYLASTTLGIYLIHENPILNKVIWHNIFKIDLFLDSYLLLPYMFAIAIIVMITSALLETIRRTIIEKPIFKIIDKFSKRKVLSFNK